MEKPTLWDRLVSYLDPFVVIAWSLYYLLLTLLTHPHLLLSSPQAFSSAWFSLFWLRLGPSMSSNPIQQAHIRDLLSILTPSPSTKKSPPTPCLTLLELGPGSGSHMARYAEAGLIPHIAHFYAAEPNVHLHGELRSAARAAGLADERVTMLAAGAEPASLLPALSAAGVDSLRGEGCFDAVIALRSLCGVPEGEMRGTVRGVQGLVKDRGRGRFLWMEHVENRGDWVSRIWVRWVMGRAWRVCVGGCRLDGGVDRVCEEVGGWVVREEEGTGEGRLGIQTLPEMKGHEIFWWKRGDLVRA
ncbi:MAG: hypothetical protein Q9160_009076 [Pyrenula sp. 1 TL-2023]